LAKSREKAPSYTQTYTQSLPDFIASEFIRRYAGPPGAGFYRLDTLTIQLRYFQHIEEHKLIQHNADPARAAFEDLHGLVGSGEFGAAISAIFSPDSQTSFHFQKWIGAQPLVSHSR
jgi:hypothetical protein